MKEVTYTCDRCGKTSSKLDGWYEVQYHAVRPHHHMIPQHDKSKHWDYCSRKCMRGEEV